MKKIIPIILLICIRAIMSAKPVLLSESPCEYMETFVGYDWNEYKSILTYEEFSSDINQLCYYLQNAYAGYEGMCGQGFDAAKLKTEFLAGYGENLFYYPVKGKNVWRIGLVSVENPKTLIVKLKGKSFLLPVYDDGAIQTSSIRYHEVESDNSVYASLSSFWLPEKDSQFRKGADIMLSKYASLASKYYDKKNIIIDLRGNPGGQAEYSGYLLYSLYTNNKKEFSWKKTPQIQQMV